LRPQTHFGAKSQSEGTIQLVPEPRKMAIIIPRRRKGTWEGVTVANWCSKWMWGGLGPHTLIFPASLSLPPMRSAAICRAPTVLQYDSFYTRISNFVQSPILSAGRVVISNESRKDCAVCCTHCNTLQHTATHCNTLQHTATHCNTILASPKEGAVIRTRIVSKNKKSFHWDSYIYIHTSW